MFSTVSNTHHRKHKDGKVASREKHPHPHLSKITTVNVMVMFLRSGRQVHLGAPCHVV